MPGPPVAVVACTRRAVITSNLARALAVCGGHGGGAALATPAWVVAATTGALHTPTLLPQTPSPALTTPTAPGDGGGSGKAVGGSVARSRRVASMIWSLTGARPSPPAVAEASPDRAALTTPASSPSTAPHGSRTGAPATHTTHPPPPPTGRRRRRRTRRAPHRVAGVASGECRSHRRTDRGGPAEGGGGERNGRRLRQPCG